MKILVIEDDNNKFNNIFNTLNSILNQCKIVRTKSAKSGLFTFIKNLKLNNRFDLIICDNYLPLYDDEIDLFPFAGKIIQIIKNKDEKTPVCVISYDDVEDCDYDYYIKYYPQIDLGKYLKAILNNIKQNKTIKPKAKKLIKKKDR